MERFTVQIISTYSEFEWWIIFILRNVPFLAGIESRVVGIAENGKISYSLFEAQEKWDSLKTNPNRDRDKIQFVIELSFFTEGIEPEIVCIRNKYYKCNIGSYHLKNKSVYADKIEDFPYKSLTEFKEALIKHHYDVYRTYSLDERIRLNEEYQKFITMLKK